MTVTRKRFSVSSFIAPEMDPIAQQSVFKFAHDHSDPSTCFDNFSVTARDETKHSWDQCMLETTGDKRGKPEKTH